MNRAALSSIIFATLQAHAVAAPDEPTAADTSGAPRPGQESGRVDSGEEAPVSISRAIGRGVLFVPRVVAAVAFAPIRGAVWVYDRYELAERYKRIFFNEAETAGLYPIAQIQSQFGFTIGARFAHRDLFGEHEHLGLQASTGGRFHQRYLATFKSGNRFGDHLGLEAGGEFEERPKDTFYGIGNDSLGVLGRHRQELQRVRTALDVRVAGDFYVRGSGKLSKLTYGPSDTGTSIEMVYDTATLPGFMDGVRDAYSEVEMRWDSRRPGSRWDPPALVSSGTLAAAFLGRDHQFGTAADYWRYGVDLQHFFRLGSGPRVLLARVYGEAVDGEDVSFTELPQLGGAMWLRGYSTDRFRDRVAVLGTLEYQWDLNRHVTASLFADAGRVYGSVEQLASSHASDDLHVGYGVGAQFHTSRAFVARTSIATSIDGGVFFNIALDPVFEIKPRETRR